MSLGELLLQLHLLGAIATIIGLVLSVRQLLFVREQYKPHAVMLASCGILQAATGVGLVLSASTIDIPRLCISGVMYLVVVGAMEIALLKRMQQVKVSVPSR